MTDRLTDRDAQIAAQYADDQNYQEIADAFCLAPSTVRTHLSSIYRKLEVSSKIELRDVMVDTKEQVPMAGPIGTLPERPSIAVLALENMSRDPDQDYLSDGVADDIITALSRSPWLFVIARNTTFTYRGKNVGSERSHISLGSGSSWKAAFSGPQIASVSRRS